MDPTSNPKLYRSIHTLGLHLDLELSRALPLEYEKLSDTAAQIRLLELLPGPDGGAIHCRLACVDREKVAGTYEPLSYCWGDQTAQIPILVNDARINIGTNLHAALARLRSSKTSRTLWVDALCINQSDIQEKNVQVQLMRNVYENGSQTLVWLGEERNVWRAATAFEIWGFANEYARSHPGGENFNVMEWEKCRQLQRKQPEYRFFGLGYLWSSASEGYVELALSEVLERD